MIRMKHRDLFTKVVLNGPPFTAFSNGLKTSFMIPLLVVLFGVVLLADGGGGVVIVLFTGELVNAVYFPAVFLTVLTRSSVILLISTLSLGRTSKYIMGDL
ncbi:MAG: hypothetical protein WBZ36_16350 [Candidatus Nitrosopolaris sp.]